MRELLLLKIMREMRHPWFWTSFLVNRFCQKKAFVVTDDHLFKSIRILIKDDNS